MDDDDDDLCLCVCLFGVEQGYGPECYVIKEAPRGIYKIRARYFSCHQASSTTGTTSVVLWTVKNFGDFEREQFTFQSIRLEQYKSEVDVALIDLAA